MVTTCDNPQSANVDWSDRLQVYCLPPVTTITRDFVVSWSGLEPSLEHIGTNTAIASPIFYNSAIFNPNTDKFKGQFFLFVSSACHLTPMGTNARARYCILQTERPPTTWHLPLDVFGGVNMWLSNNPQLEQSPEFRGGDQNLNGGKLLDNMGEPTTQTRRSFFRPIRGMDIFYVTYQNSIEMWCSIPKMHKMVLDYLPTFTII